MKNATEGLTGPSLNIQCLSWIKDHLSLCRIILIFSVKNVGLGLFHNLYHITKTDITLNTCNHSPIL